jgi:hypothetical protein
LLEVERELSSLTPELLEVSASSLFEANKLAYAEPTLVEELPANIEV